jgi:hypothetical protein
VQKASAGLALFLEASTGFRSMRRADRALPNSEFGMWNSEFFASFFPFCIPHSTFRIWVARPVHEMEAAS